MTQKKAVRHAEPPKSLSGWFVRYRFEIARRIAQLAVLALFAGTARLGWTLLGRPILSGDLSASLVLGTIPLSDPFALIQKLAAGLMPEVTLIVGALLVLAGYILLGGRSFCAWVCPMNSVTDFADWVRVKLGIKTDWVRLSSKTRYAVALGALIASAVTGSAAFEWISPQAWLWREVVWGFGLGGRECRFGCFRAGPAGCPPRLVRTPLSFGSLLVVRREGGRHQTRFQRFTLHPVRGLSESLPRTRCHQLQPSCRTRLYHRNGMHQLRPLCRGMSGKSPHVRRASVGPQSDCGSPGHGKQFNQQETMMKARILTLAAAVAAVALIGACSSPQPRRHRQHEP